MQSEKLFVKREGEFCYPIYFEQGFDNLGKYLQEEGLDGKPVCIVTDSNVAPLYLERVQEVLRKYASSVSACVIPAGEKNKNLDTISQIYTHLIENGLDRKSFIAALGGGVVGDMAGYAAATFLRGIDFIQIPTTLLSQVDSSVGGKTGVDFRQYKNMVGAFHQPRMVYMNLDTLQTLPEVEFACGMGEIIKTGLICDAAFFDFVCAHEPQIHGQEFSCISEMIRRCCQIKAGIVERDPREKGERALLNLGHTVGHAVEKLMDFRLLHGQCVAVGLNAAAWLSCKRGVMTEEEARKISDACNAFSLPVCVSGLDPEQVLVATKKDKKMEQGHIRFILMKGIGHAFMDRTVTDEELYACIREVIR